MVEQKKDKIVHFHIWTRNQGGEMYYRRAKMSLSFKSRQAARQFCQRRGMDPDRYMILACDESKCSPKWNRRYKDFLIPNEHPPIPPDKR